MHELSLASDILDRIAATTSEVEKVRTVTVTVGPLSGVSGEALGMGFESLAVDRGFTGARLVIVSVPARLRCDSCSAIYESDTFDVLCPHCGRLDRTVLSGAAFTLDSFELEE